MDYSWGEVEVEARASASVRPRGVTEGCYAAAAGVAGRGEGKAATERCLDESDEKISCFSRFFSAETGYEQVETGGGIPMAEPVVCEESREDGDAEETKEIGETGRLYHSDGQSVAGPVVLARTRTVTTECEYYRTWTIFWCWSTLSEKAFCVEKKFQLVLHRLGLRRNEKKGQWEPTQVVGHLGLEVDLKLGQFRVTERRVHKIHTRAKEILCDAARNRRWIPARRLASFTGLCQSVYLAVPAARLYLRELYFVLAEKRSWGAKVKISRAAWGDLEWWFRLLVMSRWNGRKIWRSPTRAKVHTDSSMTAWGGVLNLKFPARSFWPHEMRNWHITHLELEAVYKTVQAFLQELEGKVVRLYCDNQAVVAMLSHFTSRNPDLIQRMRRLWLLLDLHDIELQARYIRSEANVWADNLSRCEDLDDWRPVRFRDLRAASSVLRCVEGPEGPVHSEQAGRVRAARALKVGRCDVLHRGAPVSYYAAEVRRSSATSTTASKVTVGSKIEVFWKDDDCFYPGVVKEFNEDGKAHVLYDDGDEETLDLSEENFKIINSET
ncbi:hypothetical protein CYMTET_53270 [Cymbomonas tetramitiformis]|uniref:Tudor domain-containing protein n=1 Tax=Cymbomonas tetramitiformis TaxID=36881 RepID=A0AAE0BIN1_9CHLO|nr:hypothetical protein CYMTET_53270 [Cymbomonas tetramitiformis]